MTAPPTARRPRASTDPVDVVLFDEIGSYGVPALEFVDQLRAARGRPVVVHVSSPGGDLVHGLTMHYALREHDAPTTAYIGPLCASAATIVALGCNTRITAPGGQWMVHRPWVGTVGDVDDHRAAVEVLSRFGAVINDLYAERAGGTSAEWDRITTAETWFSADESVTAGLSHRVGTAVPVEASARRRLHALRADYRDRSRVAAAVRTATTHGMVAAARRSRTPDVAQLVLDGVRDGMRPDLAALVAGGIRAGVR